MLVKWWLIGCNTNFYLTPFSYLQQLIHYLKSPTLNFVWKTSAEWGIASRAAYIKLIDCFARTVVRHKVYMENRMTKPLSEWFTYTDEEFLLFCLELHSPKWNPAWWAQHKVWQKNVAAADEDARYTGKTEGTKLGWTKEWLMWLGTDRQMGHTSTTSSKMIRMVYTKENMRNPVGRQHNEETCDRESIGNCEQWLQHQLRSCWWRLFTTEE
jgi:hypothetical protein